MKDLTWNVWLPEQNLKEFRTGKAISDEDSEPVGASLTLRNDIAIELYAYREKGKAKAYYMIFKNESTDKYEFWDDVSAPNCHVNWGSSHWKEALRKEMEYELKKCCDREGVKTE